jgi:hypothetical protein
MYNFRKGRKTILALSLVVLLCLVLLPLRRYHMHTRAPSKDPASQPLFEDPIELLLTAEDVTRTGSGAAQNATLGVSHPRSSSTAIS